MNKIYALISLIPFGKVTSYKEIGRVLGSKGYRCIGKILNKNPYSPLVPCHRVVRNDGLISGFAFGIDKKISLLEKEGVEVVDGKIVDYNRRFFSFKEIFNKRNNS